MIEGNKGHMIVMTLDYYGANRFFSKLIIPLLTRSSHKTNNNYPIVQLVIYTYMVKNISSCLHGVHNNNVIKSLFQVNW